MADYYQRIEAYLDKEMTDAERRDFERDADQDTQLAAALRDVEEARARLGAAWAQTADEQALADTLRILGQQHFGRNAAAPPPPKGSARWWWLLLALVAALTAAVLLWPKKAADQKLYAEYRHFPAARFTFKSTDYATTLQQAERHFNEGNYAAALEALQTHTAAHPTDLEARLFQGLCQLETGQTDAAIATFRSYNLTGGVWVYEARWYMALAYLRQKKWGLSAEMLLQISAGEPHYEQAQRLLKQVQKQPLNG